VKTPMNDYRDAMKETSLTQEQRTRLEQAVAQARRQHETASTSKPAPRIVSRRTFAIGAAAAFVGLAGFGAINVIGGIPNNPVPNAFGLKAYALDDPARPSGYTEVLTKNVLTRNVGGYFGAWEDEDGNVVEGTLGYAFRLDLECIGENVASYSYHIEGDKAYFGLTGKEGAVPEEFFPNGSFFLKKYECSESFVVTKENQQKFGPEKDHVPLIVLALPMNEEFQAAYESACLADQQNTMTTEAGDAFDRLIELNAAQRISACLLKVTATYEDGTSETKKYMISPVENFEELYLAFQEKRSERLLKEWEGEPQTDARPEEPELYTITQVA